MITSEARCLRQKSELGGARQPKKQFGAGETLPKVTEAGSFVWKVLTWRLALALVLLCDLGPTAY